MYAMVCLLAGYENITEAAEHICRVRIPTHIKGDWCDWKRYLHK